MDDPNEKGRIGASKFLANNFMSEKMSPNSEHIQSQASPEQERSPDPYFDQPLSALKDKLQSLEAEIRAMRKIMDDDEIGIDPYPSEQYHNAYHKLVALNKEKERILRVIKLKSPQDA